MNWLLVAIVAGHPVATDLRFPTLFECMKAEEAARIEHVKRVNLNADFLKPDDKTKALWLSQIPSGTCIPAR